MTTPAALVGGATELASLPSVWLRLRDAAADPRGSVADVARIISEDPALTARLLRLVNSALYGLSARVDTVSQAIAMAGMTQVTDLALASAVLRVFRGIPPERVDMEAFWRHSVAVGTAARVLAEFRCERNPERAFVAGLMHDVGRLVLFLEEPSAMARLLEASAGAARPLVTLEREQFGFDHADVGRQLLETWSLPVSLTEPVGCHHEPWRAGEFALETAIVHVADHVALALGLGHSGSRLLAPFAPEAWAQLGLDEADLPAILRELERQFADVVQVMALAEEPAAAAPRRR